MKRFYTAESVTEGHPAYYRHIVKDAKEKFTRFARELSRDEIYDILMECM